MPASGHGSRKLIRLLEKLSQWLWKLQKPSSLSVEKVGYALPIMKRVPTDWRRSSKIQRRH